MRAVPQIVLESPIEPAVLLIDDSATVRKIAKDALARAGFSVIEALDGLDGLEKLQAADAPIGAIFCDVNMPRMSGIDFVEKLATLSVPKPPVMMLTTEEHPDLVRRAKASGVRGWMLKPFKTETLVEVAKKLTAKS